MWSYMESYNLDSTEGGHLPVNALLDLCMAILDSAPLLLFAIDLGLSLHRVHPDPP